jgi:hypothetical protein
MEDLQGEIIGFIIVALVVVMLAYFTGKLQQK